MSVGWRPPPILDPASRRMRFRHASPKLVPRRSGKSLILVPDWWAGDAPGRIPAAITDGGVSVILYASRPRHPQTHPSMSPTEADAPQPFQRKLSGSRQFFTQPPQYPLTRCAQKVFRVRIVLQNLRQARFDGDAGALPKTVHRILAKQCSTRLP